MILYYLQYINCKVLLEVLLTEVLLDKLLLEN